MAEEDRGAKRPKLAGGRLKFRNYRPQDEVLNTKSVGNALPKPVLDEAKIKADTAAKAVENSTAAETPKTENAIQRELRSHKEEHGEEDALNIAPRKPNWDLKRDLMKKMETLNRRTQIAIVDLIRERIENEEDDDDDDDEE